MSHGARGVYLEDGKDAGQDFNIRATAALFMDHNACTNYFFGVLNNKWTLLKLRKFQPLDYATDIGN